jgi:adenine phosphoribosyltransferase
MDLRALVREIPDFPHPGILFRDITPLLLDPDALDGAIAELAASVDVAVDFVVAAEARGFILGAALARQLHAGFVPARKPGKLPADTVSAEYALEYGLVHDDLLATGGTARALCELVTDLGGEIVGCSFLVELSALGGRARLAPHPVRSLITFEQ